MTTTQTIMWIALPNGYVGEGAERRLRLSVFVAPRLRSDAGTKLALFPDFVDWATRMAAATFTVEVKGGPAVPATIVSEAPEPLFWSSLFGPDIPVRPFVFDDYADRPIVSYPVQEVLTYVKHVYTHIAANSPTELPRITQAEDGGPARPPTLKEQFDTLLENLQGLRQLETEEQLSRRLELSLEEGRFQARQRRAKNERGGALIEPDGVGGGIGDAFYRAMLFHYRARQAEPVELPQDEAAEVRFTDEFDFHQMLTALADYPPLLRRLGLAFDLELPDGALPISDNEFTPRQVCVVPTWTSDFASLPADPGTLDVSPYTKYALASFQGQDLFVAWPTGDNNVGFWQPPVDSVDLVQVDPDGAALKTLHHVNTIGRIIDGQPQAIDAPERDGLSAMRTSGLAVVHTGRAAAMAKDFNQSFNLNKLLEQNPPALDPLVAEDLHRGYRIDVQDAMTGEWFSLHRRVGTFNALNYPNGPFDLADEGFTQAGATTPAEKPGTPPDPTAEIYVHEALFTWDGWSLSAPRPGKALSRSARAPSPAEPGTEPDYVPNRAVTALKLEVGFRPQDGTLPRLRFGRPYLLRVRTVDLAGNGLTKDEATALVDAFGGQLNPMLPKNRELIYSRFEPVNPPEVVPRAPFTEGESAARLVIRADFDRSAEAYAAEANEWLAANAPEHTPYAAVNERHLAAPKSSLAQVEAHGLLDEAFDAKAEVLGEEAVRAIRRAVYDLAVRESGSLNDTTLPTVIFVPTSAADPTQGYAIHTEEQVALPYLPDPWSGGAVFQGLPGLPPGQLTTVIWGGAVWHEAPPFRLLLAEGGGPPQWDKAARTLTVFLPRSGVATVRVSSLLNGEVAHFGLWRWLKEAVDKKELTPAQLDDIYHLAKEGRHWMFTPFRELTLVHATQRPLEQPELLELMGERNENETAVLLRGVAELHVPSTAKLDLLATWKEPRDDPALPKPDEVEGNAHVMEIPIDLRGQPIEVCYQGDQIGLELEDERYLIFNALNCSMAAQALRQPPAAPPSPEEAARRDKERLLAEKITAHELGDTKYRRVRYHLAATSRFREYYPQKFWENLSRAGAEWELEMLATARPDAPRLRYVLPTFGWAAEDDGQTATSRRLGGGLRIYLERGWWSAGDGELLAVVLGPHFPSKNNALYRYSTYWGQDPLYTSPPLRLPQANLFRNAVQVETRVLLAELPEWVTVVAYMPQFDETLKLWTVDLDLPTGEHYFPFVRLALARFQPKALVKESVGGLPPTRDLRLSSVILADFVQTAPNRALTLTRDGGGPGIHTVHVSGKAYTARRALSQLIRRSTSRMLARLERRAPEIADEALAWSPLPGAAEVLLLPSIADADGTQHWQGNVALPAEAAGETLRLVVNEIEEYDNGPDARRVVYVDTVGL